MNYLCFAIKRFVLHIQPMKDRSNQPAFITIQPKVLYFGTPVALLSTIDQEGKANISPISSAWALGYQIMLGLGCDSKTFQNILSSKECVVNLPSADLYDRIEKIAHLTGLHPVPESKREKYRFEADKFTAGNFQPLCLLK